MNHPSVFGGHLRRFPLIALAAALLTLPACRSDPAGPGVPMRSLTDGETSLVRASNVFAFDLLRDLDADDRTANLFISPLSASMALGMTMTGTAGDTYAEMRDMLGFNGMSDTEVSSSYRSLIALLRGADRNVDFRIGNSIWYRNGFQVHASFLEATRSYFSAEVAQLDFASPQAVTTINSWVSTATAGRIPTIVDQIPPDVVMYLINAIYFKGAWTDRFDPARTMQRAFRTPTGDRNVPMMSRTGLYPAVQTQKFSVAELPYGRGGGFSMVVLVPFDGVSVDEIVNDMDSAGWDELVAGLIPQHGSVNLPRFKMEWERTLNASLQRLGMRLAFSEADFSRLSPQGGLYVSEVRQKTFVEVNEAGTEAAAVTSVAIAESLPPTLIDADRPFIFAIRERSSGAILFVGVMRDPTRE